MKNDICPMLTANNKKAKVETLLICPVRNEVEKIGRLIKSLQKQTRQQWVIFIYDNNSDDGTVKAVREFARIDSRVCLEGSVELVPVAQNFNRAACLALELFDPDYIAFVGGDDEFLEADYLENLITSLINGASIAVPSFRLISDISGETRELRFDTLSNSNFINKFRMAVGTEYVALMLSLYRKDEFERILQDRHGRLSNSVSTDWWFVFCAFETIAHPAVFVAESTYIKHEKGISQSSNYYRPRQYERESKGLRRTKKVRAESTTLRLLSWRTTAALKKTFFEPVVHFWFNRHRLRIADIPEMMFLWLVMTLSRIMNLVRNQFPH